MTAEVLEFKKTPSKDEIQKIIQECVKTGKIKWSYHARCRLKERSITTLQVINCLTKGRVTENPFYSHSNGGGYETSIERGTAGEWLKVVVCVKVNNNLLVITVIN